METPVYLALLPSDAGAHVLFVMEKKVERWGHAYQSSLHGPKYVQCPDLNKDTYFDLVQNIPIQKIRKTRSAFLHMEYCFDLGTSMLLSCDNCDIGGN